LQYSRAQPENSFPNEAGLKEPHLARTVIVVVGPGGGAEPADVRSAFELGRLIAREGWVLVTGGRDAGVMDAVNKGAIAAREAGEGDSVNCITVGILPGEDTSRVSAAIDVPIVTGMGSARNNINALTGQVVIACGMGLGTASEIALALKSRKKVILLGGSRESRFFFAGLGAQLVDAAEEAIQTVKIYLKGSRIGKAEMIQLRAKELEGGIGLTANPQGRLYIFTEEAVELRPGDEVLLRIERPGTDLGDYDLAIILTGNAEPQEDEFLAQYGDKLFVAQKAPDHI